MSVVLCALLALAPASVGMARDRRDGDYGQPRHETRSAPPAGPQRNYAPPPQRYSAPYDAGRYPQPGYGAYSEGRDRYYEPRRDLPPNDPNAHPVRGRLLPSQHMGNVVADPARYRLRRPPPGYHWVYVGRDLYLVQNTTGMIVDQIEGGRY